MQISERNLGSVNLTGGSWEDRDARDRIGLRPRHGRGHSRTPLPTDEDVDMGL